MKNKKVIHTLFSGLGGHTAVVFPFLESKVSKEFDHCLVFYGVEKVNNTTIEMAQTKGAVSESIVKKPKQYLKPFNQFRLILKRESPDAIVVHNSELLWPALSWRRTHPKCTIIYVEHQDEAKKNFILRRLSKTAAKKADYIVCLNQTTADLLKGKYNYQHPIVVIPNGINTQFFKPVNRDENKNTIGMAARMVEGKDHSTLIRAFSFARANNPTLRLKIAGDGPTLEHYKTIANELKLNDSISFLGRVPEDAMPQFYAELDIYIQATFAETMSTSILQAMACKIPVIASDIVNNRILIDDQNTGVLYDNNDVEGLSNQILMLHKNKTQRQNLANNAYNLIQASFTHEAMAARYVQLINGKFDH